MQLQTTVVAVVLTTYDVAVSWLLGFWGCGCSVVMDTLHFSDDHVNVKY